MVSILRQKKDSDRKERTNQELLNAAVEVFSEKGYHETLISDIVARAGVGQGTFYRNFKNKRDLIDEIMDKFGYMLLGKFAGMTANLPTNADEYREASLKAVGAMADVIEQNRKLVLLVLREGPTVDREFEQRINNLFDQFAGLAAFYLDNAIAKGYARPCNSAVVAQAIVGMGVRHITKWLQDGENDADVRDLIKETVDFAFFGLAAQKAPQSGDAT